MALSELQIINAADDFFMKYDRIPSFNELHRKLGSGSISTISKYFRPWKENKERELLSCKAASNDIEIVTIPQKISETLVTEWSHALNDIKRDNQNKLDAIHTTLKIEAEALKAKITEQSLIIDMLENEDIERQNIYDSAIYQIDSLKQTLVVKENELSAQNGRIIEMEKQIITATENCTFERKRVDELQTKIILIQSQLAVTEERLSQYARNVSDSQADNN